MGEENNWGEGDIDENNWEEYQNKLDKMYNKIPKNLRETVGDIVDLEMELEKISNM